MINSIKYRRYFARVTLPFLMIWLCILPSKSYAVVPALLLPLAAEAIAADGTAVVLADMTAQAVANLVGMTWSSINFYKLSSSAKVTVPLTTFTLPLPVAPSTVLFDLEYKVRVHVYSTVAPSTYDFVYGSSLENICASLPSGHISAADVDQCLYNAEPSDPTAIDTGIFLRGDLISTNPCGSGYSPSHGFLFTTCNLVNSVSAVQDATYNLSRSSSGFNQDTNDADLVGLNNLTWTNSSASSPAVKIIPLTSPKVLPTPVPRNADIDALLSSMFITGSGAGVQAFGKNSNGTTSVYQVNKRADFGTDFYILQPTVLPDGTTGTNYQKISISPNAVVESVTNVKTAEKLQVSTAPSPNPKINPYNDPFVDPFPVIEYPYLVPAGQTAPAYAPLTGVSPSLTPVFDPVPYTSPAGNTSGATFPSDYARQGEAKNAADSLAPKLDKIGDALSKDSTAVVDPTEVDPHTMPTFDTTFDSLKGWHLPAHTSACPQPSVMLFGKNYTLSSHCTLMQEHGAPLHQAMVVVFSVLALFIVLRA